MPQLSSATPALFKGRHFDHLLIIQSVRWYITYKLSYRDVCALMAERGVSVVHTTVMRWVQHYVPVFEKRWMKYARPRAHPGVLMKLISKSKVDGPISTGLLISRARQ